MDSIEPSTLDIVEDQLAVDSPIVQTLTSEYYLPEFREIIQLEPHQRRILNAAFQEKEPGRLKYSTIVYSCPKKSGKTEVAGGVTYSYVRTYGGNCYSIANDKDQSRSRMFERVVDSLRVMATKNPDLYAEVIDPANFDRITKGNKIAFSPNDQFNPGPHWLQYIASDYAGEAGGMPSLTVWDELWAYRTQSAYRLWDEMQPIPTIPSSIRFITNYAGWHGESELLWSIYNAVVKPHPYTGEPEGQRVPGLEDLPCYEMGGYFVYWDHTARMPWHTPEFMENAKDDPSLEGRESEFRRIWEKRWTTGMDAFIDIEVIDGLMELGEELKMYNRFDRYESVV